LIGAVVLAVAGGFLVYAANTADMGVGGGYPLAAEFRAAEGLAAGSDVRLSGVKIGSVTSIGLNPQNYFAAVGMSIDEMYKVPEDSIAKIVSDGLLGGNYVAIDPGASEFMLEPGAAFMHTQGSINLLDLVAKAIHGGGG
ncbi:MAG TPA: outer membrane lipid asymmetry maintenance protein MlaD, partial [Paracoccaceae bacterium]|nr:outer membrane lipid asymmetry maintenance protein MlaD [Paracoccaceae bacterium]